MGAPLRVVLLPGVAVAPDFDVELFGEGVDAGDAYAVEAAGDFVVGGVELAAGVEHGEDDLDGGHLLAVDDLVVDGDAAAVVDDGDGVIDVDGDVDAGGVAAEGLVDGVVDDLVDEVVEALFAGRADVHGGAQADGGEALEHGDVLGGVAAAFYGLGFRRLLFGGNAGGNVRLRGVGRKCAGCQKYLRTAGARDGVVKGDVVAA